MAANTIGGIVMDIFKGTMLVSVTGMQVIRRPGRDFDRTRAIGLQGRLSSVETIQVEAVDAAALVLKDQTYPNTVGGVISVTDSLGDTYTNVAVINMVIASYGNVIHEGASKKQIVAQWTFLVGDQT